MTVMKNKIWKKKKNTQKWNEERGLIKGGAKYVYDTVLM